MGAFLGRSSRSFWRDPRSFFLGRKLEPFRGDPVGALRWGVPVIPFFGEIQSEFLFRRSSRSFFGDIQSEPLWENNRSLFGGIESKLFGDIQSKRFGKIRVVSGEIQSEPPWGHPVGVFLESSRRSIFGEIQSESFWENSLSIFGETQSESFLGDPVAAFPER